MRKEAIQEIPQEQIKFPFLLYFKQLFAANIYVKFINPFSFWRRYKINHLETCLEFDTIRHLETCQHLKLQSKKLHNIDSIKLTKPKIDKNNILPNKILIAQPIVKLKYRGVTYYRNKISE